jgi:hypothetical protein
MRSVAALLFVLAGCHAASPPAPSVGGLSMEVTLSTASTAGDVAIASAALRLAQVVAVSDRSAADPRATMSDLDLALGDTRELALPIAPPGIYSAVDAQLGSSSDGGLDIQAVWNAVRVHVTLQTHQFDVACASPASLTPHGHVSLTLQADPAGWFDGLDLAGAASDADDEGIVISEDDNRPMAEMLLGNVLASITLDCAAD